MIGFGKLKDHKKKIALAVAVFTALAAYLVGDCDLACVAKIVAPAVGL